jgi:hypothetical protein
MREIRTSGSVGAAGGNSRGDPTVLVKNGGIRALGKGSAAFNRPKAPVGNLQPACDDVQRGRLGGLQLAQRKIP